MTQHHSTAESVPQISGWVAFCAAARALECDPNEPADSRGADLRKEGNHGE